MVDKKKEKILSFIKKRWKLLLLFGLSLFVALLAWKLALPLLLLFIAEGDNSTEPSLATAKKEIQKERKKQEKILKARLNEKTQAEQLAKEAGPDPQNASSPTPPTDSSSTSPEPSPSSPLEDADLQKLVELGDKDTEKEQPS